MKVSIRLITYNHAPFIRQAIEGVLAQKTSFPFEVVIGEDGSNDGTREIVREYEAKYPGKIRVLYNDRKDVIYIKGKPSGRWNFMNTLKNCTAPFVAFLDGDDYWTSPDKLQKQVDFMEKNPQCTVCFHDVLIAYEGGTETSPYFIKKRQLFYSLEELLEGRVLPQSSSLMYRNGIVHDYPKWFFTLPFADLPLLVLHGEHGSFGFIDEVMSVYRKNRASIWSGGADYEDWPVEKKISCCLDLLEYNETMRGYLPAKYRPVLQNRIGGLNYELVWLYQCQRNFPKMRKHLRDALSTKALHSQWPATFVLKAWLIACFPFLHRIYQPLKKMLRGSASAPERKTT